MGALITGYTKYLYSDLLNLHSPGKKNKWLTHVHHPLLLQPVTKISLWVGAKLHWLPT